MSKIYETCYVYKIINDIDDLIYIGSTADKLCKRMVYHRMSARKEKDKNRKLYLHINLHGIEHFKIILVEEYKNINRETLRKHEYKFIKDFNTVKNGLNGCYANGITCEHNKSRSRCKDCGGSQICEHNRLRSKCKECHWGSICEHNKERDACKECGGSKICEHNRIRSKCKECGGSSICEHHTVVYECKDCNNFKCDFCEKKLCSKRNLAQHMNTCKKKPENDKCLFSLNE